MKKILSGILILLLFTGCSSNESKSEDVTSIELELVSTEFYKGQPIEISMNLNNNYQLTEDDFSCFGATIEIDDKDTAYLTYNGAGTFHVSATVGDVTSNELTIQVHTNTASNGSSATKKESTSSNNTKEESQETQTTTNKDDYTNWENVRDASDDKVTNIDDFNNNPDAYSNQSFILEGTVPSDSDGTYLVTSDGTKVPLSGLTMGYVGTVRVYGSYDGSTFHVQSYCAFSSEKLDTENSEE